MSKDNFDDAMHIVKKINYFLGMCLQDVDHLNYEDNEKQMLRMLMNVHGNMFLNNIVESVIVTNNLSNIKLSKGINVSLTEEDSKRIQEEWDKVINGKTKRLKLETRDLFSESQENKTDVEKGTGDPRNPEMEEGGKGA